MSDLIVPLIILAGLLGGCGLFVYWRVQAGRAFDQVLEKRGFRRDINLSGEAIDFTVTLQWPPRVVTYVKQFTKQETGALLTVANVYCWEPDCSRTGPYQAEQTIMSCSFPQHATPRFCLCPRDGADRFRNLSEGGEEITIGDPAFDEAFFILGSSKENVMSVLKVSVRAEMLALSDVMVASGNSSVILFRHGVVLSAQELGRFLDLLDTIRRGCTCPWIGGR